MFAGCGSEWKKPWRKTIVIHVSAIRYATSRRSSGRMSLEIELGDLRPAQELERQDASGRVLADDRGHDDARRVREVPVEGFRVPRLVRVVELEANRARELVDELLWIDELERAHALLQELRRLVEEPEVGLDLPRRLGALNLDRDLLAVREHGPVHLPDRGGGERLLVELDERLLHGQPELGLDRGTRLLERERRHVVLQAAQLDHDVRRHDVRPRREQLAELDERRAELVEHLPEPPPAVGDRVAVRAVVPGQEIAEPVPAQEVAEAMSRGDLRDLRQASEAARRPFLPGGHGRIVGVRPGCALRGALEQLQPVLELRDAELELADRLARGDAELGAEARGRRAGRLAHPPELAAPAVEHVVESRTHLAPRRRRAGERARRRAGPR